MLENKDELRTVGMKLLARREYSSVEFQKRLLQKFPEKSQEIKTLSHEFTEKNWLSDERMVEAFIHDQVAFTQTGPLKIELKLRAKGVASEIIHDAMKRAFPSLAQQEVIRALSAKKYAEIRQRGKTGSELEARQKVQKFLMGKGFPWDEVKDI